MSDWSAAVAALFPAFKAAGLLVEATISDLESPPDVDTIDVIFRRPGTVLGIGIVTVDYEIEYQTADRALLAEGHGVVIGSESFRVRESPLAKDDGYFSMAILTKL